MDDAVGFDARKTTADNAVALAAIVQATAKIRLASAGPVSPNRDDLAADYTTCVFTNYADSSVVNVNTGRDSNNDDVVLFDQKQFVADDPLVTTDVVDFVLVFLPGTPDLLQAVIQLDDPIEVNFPNQTLTVVVKFNASTMVWTVEVQV